MSIFAPSGTFTPASEAIVKALCPTIFAFSEPFMMIVFLTFSSSPPLRK